MPLDVIKQVVLVNGVVAAGEPEVPVDPPNPDRLVVEEPDLGRGASKRGRPRKARSAARIEEVLHLYFVERLSMRKVAEVLGMSHMSVYRMLSDPNVELLL
jgi:hypothetical protein